MSEWKYCRSCDGDNPCRECRYWRLHALMNGPSL